MATYAQATDTLGKKLRRVWFGSYITSHNVEQCPRCGGTDKARHMQEGFAIQQWRCERCEKEWWT